MIFSKRARASALPKTILLVGAAALVVFGVVTVLIARRAPPIAPSGDIAVIESYTLRAAGGHLTVGPYSRFQWHHPGPIYFYGLAPFYKASGDNTAGLAAAAATINLAMLALAVWIAASSGGPLCGAIVGAALTAYVLRVPDLFTSAWNPHVVVLPLAVAVLASAAAAAGRSRLLPVAAVAASFAAQTHVGTLPPACAAGAVGAVFVALRARRDRSALTSLAATIVVTLVVWLPSIVEQATHRPGNLSALWQFFAAGLGTGQPFRSAFIDWANMLTGVVRPGFYLAHGWTLRLGRSPQIQALAIGELAVLLAGAASAAWRRRFFESALASILFAASLLALWSVTHIEGDVIDHEIFWISSLGALNVAVAAYLALAPFVSHIASARAGDIAAAALVAVCALVDMSRMIDVRTRAFSPGPESAGIVRAAAGIRTYLEAARVSRPFVDIDQGSWNLAAGVLLQLQKAGITYAVDDDWLPMFTEAARATGGERLVLSVSGAARHVVLRSRPGVQTVIESDPVYVDAYGFITNK